MYKKWCYKLGYVIILGMIIFICLNLFPLKYNIRRSVNGLKWEFDNAEAQEKVTITMDGEYVRYVLHFFHSSDYFQGSFSVSGYEYTENADCFLFRVNFNPKHNNMGILSYGGTNGADGGILGTIYPKDQLSQGVIMIGRKSTDSGNQKVISFPCEERAEAVDLARELLPEGFVFE